MFRAFLNGIFVGDVQWAWRRRVAVTSAAVMLAGIINSIFFDHDLAHATMVMSECMTGISLVFTIYVSGAVADDHFKRRGEVAGNPVDASRP